MRQKIMNNGDKLEEACSDAQMCQWPLIAKFSGLDYIYYLLKRTQKAQTYTKILDII